MQLEDFNFILPEELIARYPLAERDASRMLVYNKAKQHIEHKQFRNLVDLLKPGDILVRNNSQVMQARFFVTNQFGTQIEIFLYKHLEANLWQALAKPAKRIKPERKFYQVQDCQVEIFKTDDIIYVDFLSKENYEKIISTYGQMPIPPYFKRASEEVDKQRYQTIYAQQSQSGYSVAAPTAGLHFTDEILSRIQKQGIEIIDTTLHVGLGTFAPIQQEDIVLHKMHSEYYEVSEKVWSKITEAKKQQRRIIAIGSTSTRILETVALRGELNGHTDLYIYPSFKFQIVDAMLTNFHLPKSSLLIMISAFLSIEEVKKIYQEAITERYRFFSYGDCCFFQIC